MREWGFAAVLVVAALASWLLRRMHERENAKLPVETAQAVVVDRQMVKYHRGRGLHARTVMEFHVTFRTEHTGRKAFQVSEAEYDAYRLGSRGPLSWQGDALVSFRPERREAISREVPVGFNEENVE